MDAGGTLEIHGVEKTPWTKLTKTLPKLDADNGLILQHSVSLYNNDGRLYVYATYPKRPKEFGITDVHIQSQKNAV